jgi:uncharacterized membrane protein
MGRPHRDERGVIVNWLVRIAITTAVVGVILFDAGSIAVNFFGLDATADDIAVKVSSVAKSTNEKIPPLELEEEARKLAKEADAKLVSFEFDPVGHQVKLTIKREANTIIVSRVGAMEDWGKATAESEAATQ